jgi:activator of HSP90 ATPase
MPQPAIIQSVKFSFPPATLFEMYMDSAKHTAATGQPAKISRRAGGRFTAFGGALWGRNLLIIPNQMIVQAWRSTGWKRGDSDSILVLQFSKAPGGSQVDLVHVNVPVQDHQGVTKGWEKYYWTPWKNTWTQRNANAQAHGTLKRQPKGRS